MNLREAVQNNMKKGEVYEGVIEKVTFPNKGHVPVDGQEVIVKNGIPGQKIRFRIHKKRKNQVEGILMDILENSPKEQVPAGCSLFPSCGGCMYRTMKYEDQLTMKEEQIRALMDQALIEGGQVKMLKPETESTESGDGSVNGKESTKGNSGPACAYKEEDVKTFAVPDYTFEGVKGSPVNNGYRNKMEYSFGDDQKDGPLTLGLHKKASTYDILTADDCRIVHEDFNRILRCVLDFCTEKNWPYLRKMTHVGYLRHLLVRRAVMTGEILVDLVTTSQYEMDLSEGNPRKQLTGEEMSRAREMRTEESLTAEQGDLMELTARIQALELEGEIAGILHTVNDSLADVVQNDHTDILAGRDYFYEELLGLKFKITPFSFFQTNSKGAEVLYSTAREFLGDIDNQTVFDLYSGTGTIAQMLAPVAKNVVGVEIVEEAVEAAKENAALNGLDNCTFIAGDVLKVLDDLKEKPDTIVLDPPRDGIHPKALPKIVAYGVDKIIYISCKPTSLARDLPYFLHHGYRLERICCVDMFPGTVHVESCVLLERVSNRKADSYVKLNVKMEDYYRIKETEGGEVDG
jgi:tRNA/tmRNA/rRNA uracil-C5-methylase (TrmA/RlmC/RlmD family)